MKKISFKHNGVYFFSGENNESKISFLENIINSNDIKNNCLFNIHDIRRFIFGDHYTYDLKEQEIYQISYGFEDFSVIETLLNIIKMRSKQGILTIVDIDKLTDKQNKKLINYFISEKIKFDFFDFTDKDILSHKEVNFNTEIYVEKFELKHTNIDAVGDVHGLYDELVDFITELGYEVNDYHITHKENRKLLFLGDVVDRGQQSLKMLKLLYNSVVHNGHYAIIGNHENKLLQFKKHYERFGSTLSSNNATSETILELLQIDSEEMMKYLDFIENLPHYYTYKDIAFTHGNLDYFEPTSVIKSKVMYGSGKSSETDLKYQILFNKGVNKYTLIRGHYIQENDHQNVFSLEREQAFNGHLAILHLDKFLNERIEKGNISAFKDNTKLFKTHFDFIEHSKKFDFVKVLEEHCKNELLIKLPTKNGFHTLYKYTEKFNNSNLLSFDSELNEANGIVVDLASNIIINPPKRIFNFNSLPNKKIYQGQKFIARDKINGINFNIGYNSINKSLIYATSNFILDFKIKSAIDKISNDLQSIMIDFIKQKNYTLSFSYSESQDKLYLLNVKSNSQNYYEYTELEMDKLVYSWNEDFVIRPLWGYSLFEDIISNVENNNQSFIVKSINEDYLFYIDSHHVQLYNFISSLSKENKNLVNKKKLPKNITKDQSNLLLFFMKSPYRNKIFFLNKKDFEMVVSNYLSKK